MLSTCICQPDAIGANDTSRICVGENVATSASTKFAEIRVGIKAYDVGRMGAWGNWVVAIVVV